MGFAERHHPAATVPNDHRAFARCVRAPQGEAQVAQQPEPLGVPELGTEPVLVFDDASPQGHRPEHRRVARPAQLIRVVHRVEPAGAGEVGDRVGPMPDARRRRGASGRPWSPIAGDRRQVHPRPVTRSGERPAAPGQHGFDRCGWRLEKDGTGAHAPGWTGSGTSGSGSRSGTSSGSGSETGSTSMIRCGRPMSIRRSPERCRLPEPTPAGPARARRAFSSGRAC